MPTLLLRFPGGRYHATPWGHHVNEGLIEWPPSPWRLLRALLSTGYTTLGWSGETPPIDARSLIEKLANVLPTYRLPPAIGAHSRHYMPLGILDKGREKTTLVFDTWAQVNNEELAITWDVKLNQDEQLLLEKLAAHLGYLGRSESWVSARIGGSDESLPAVNECCPCDKLAMPGPGWEQIPLLAVQPPQAYTEWRQSAISSALADLPVVDASKKKLSKDEKKALEQRQKAEAPYPAGIVECMQVTTTWLRSHGWSQPPGSRRVFYWRRIDALEVGAPKAAPARVTAPMVESMLLSMATASGNDHALPSVVRTLPQAELLHRALVGIAGKNGSNVPSVLTGCDESGRPLTGNHSHAHMLPLDLDGDGHLDHVLIWAPMGLDASAQRTIRAICQTFTKGGVGPLRLTLVGAGDLQSLRDLRGQYGKGMEAVLGPKEGETEWISVSPFVPPRFVKKRGRNTLEGQVLAECESRGYPAPVEIEVIDPRSNPKFLPQRHFVRSRRFGPAAPTDYGISLRLCFDRLVCGPLCLGYGSHFGLGLFMTSNHDQRKISPSHEALGATP